MRIIQILHRFFFAISPALQLVNYQVGCDNILQKTHQKLTVWSLQNPYYKDRKHYLETHRLGVYRTPLSKPASTPMS